MKRVDYEVHCLMCGAEIGQLVHGRFERHTGCTTPLPRRLGLLRCCHCGGSLYLEPIDRYRAPIRAADLRIQEDEEARASGTGRATTVRATA